LTRFWDSDAEGDDFQARLTNELATAREDRPEAPGLFGEGDGWKQKAVARDKAATTDHETDLPKGTDRTFLGRLFGAGR